MTSREIVIDLIDKGLITGEQAFTLINDIVAAEIKEALEIIEKSKKNQSSGIGWVNIGDSPWSGTTITTTPNWVYTQQGTSCASGNTSGDCYATTAALQANANTYTVKSV